MTYRNCVRHNDLILSPQMCVCHMRKTTDPCFLSDCTVHLSKPKEKSDPSSFNDCDFLSFHTQSTPSFVPVWCFCWSNKSCHAVWSLQRALQSLFIWLNQLVMGPAPYLLLGLHWFPTLPPQHYVCSFLSHLERLFKGDLYAYLIYCHMYNITMSNWSLSIYAAHLPLSAIFHANLAVVYRGEVMAHPDFFASVLGSSSPYIHFYSRCHWKLHKHFGYRSSGLPQSSRRFIKLQMLN